MIYSCILYTSIYISSKLRKSILYDPLKKLKTQIDYGTSQLLVVIPQSDYKRRITYMQSDHLYMKLL